MQKGVDDSLRPAPSGGSDSGCRRYQVPELLVFGKVGELTFGPAGALTDFPEPGYSFAE